MQDNLTDIICILDRSGSMESVRSDAVGGFNSFLADQQQQPGDAHFTLVLFNHDYLLLYDHVDIAQAQPLDNSSYQPQGTTALLDAVGRTIDDVGQRLAQTPEPQRPAKVIVAILTDGLENASKDYSRSRIAQMIKLQQETYSWEFIFLAANQDAIATAREISIAAQDAVSFAATPDGTRHAHMRMSQEVTRRRRS